MTFNNKYNQRKAYANERYNDLMPAASIKMVGLVYTWRWKKRKEYVVE